ncbi:MULTISPECIES: tol-pal system protein YbgF [unclassified Bradyrhizobium]|uniref:tol-pal system protein YbgF n=1 Tax=unclassified Bradyrhizobium TaxID=2631580 RepID=UPI000486D41A|nr:MULTISPECIES: tol-pal system protein YbgF [unclassified Bradyrhizobium]MCP3461180.1 tol-pal system protein YbgF [Bradyrhizobium sp. CCGUVB23]
MSSRFQAFTGTVAIAALLSLCSPAFAQSDDADPEMRIERLENQLRQLTGQNEELQYRNRQLEERLRQLEGGAQGAPGQGPAQPNVAAAPPMQPAPGYRQQQQPVQQPAYEPQVAAPAPIVQEQPAPGAPGTRRRGDAFDPNQNPNAPGAPRALGGGQQPMAAGAPVGAPGGRGAGEPLDLGNTGGRYPQAAAPAAQPGYPAAQPGYPAPAAGGGLATQPPSQSPRDEFDLGIGYMQRKDYALAEQTMKTFTQKYPSDPLLGDAQYWLGESYFQRQQYRDAAEAFLAVTTKYDKSAKAPDSLLRLGQSLAALKEKEAACAAFGEVGRKFPRASAGVKAAVDREQKRVKC